MILCLLYGLTYLSLALQNPSFQRIRSPSTEPPQVTVCVCVHISLSLSLSRVCMC